MVFHDCSVFNLSAKCYIFTDSSQVTPNHESGVPVLEDSNKERGTVPKAMVRPQQTNILTHVIEGYVIQEGKILILLPILLTYAYTFIYSKRFQFCQPLSKRKKPIV